MLVLEAVWNAAGERAISERLWGSGGREGCLLGECLGGPYGGFEVSGPGCERLKLRELWRGVGKVMVLCVGAFGLRSQWTALYCLWT